MAVPRQSFVIHPNGGWWQSIIPVESFANLHEELANRVSFIFG
jgi:hypothetical protein